MEDGKIALSWQIRPGDVARTERRFLDFIIGGQSLWSSLDTDLISCLGWLPAEHNADAVLRLLLNAPADFPDDRRSLYICPECADLGCGAISVLIERSSDQIIWRDFGYQNDYTPEVNREDFDDFPGMTFDAVEYERVIKSALNI